MIFSSRGYIAKELVHVADKYIPFESIKSYLRKKSHRLKKRRIICNLITKNIYLKYHIEKYEV